MERKPKRKLYAKHACRCEVCREKWHPDDKTRTLHELINRLMCTLDERGRRLFAGLVLQWNGEDKRLTAAITGLHPATSAKGLEELKSDDYRKLADEGRTRSEGGGRPPKS